MKRLLPWLLILAALISKPLLPGAQARTLRLFVIGNSFSQNATRYLPELAREGGHEVIIGRAEYPAASLQKHWEAVEAAEAKPDDPAGKLYGGKSLRELLSAGTWEIVTIQQGSFPSGDVESYRPYAQKLRDFIKKLQPQAELVLHQTWPYRSDAAKFAAIGGGQTAGSDREMWEKTLVAYHTIAAELGVRLIPVGDAFWRVRSDPQWAYKKDPKFDFEKPVQPNLPDQTNSLHRGYLWEDGKFILDANHASDAGCYLAGLVWYGFLFDESPEKLTFAPPSVPTPFAAHLRQVAAQTLNDASTHLTAQSPGTVTTPQAQPHTQPQPQKPGLTTAQGQGADTSVRGGETSSRNFGHMDILRVRNASNLQGARKVYLRFDLSALPTPVKSATGATLTLTIAPAEGASPADKVWTFTVYGLKDAVAGEDWSEPTANWDNAPANDVKTAAAVMQDAVALGTFTITGKGEEGKTVTFSSPELVKFLQSDTNGKATLIITRNESGDTTTDNVVHIFASKENAKLAAPSLSVTF
ncbi:MAG: DUF4886 domain-containing protein [Armatimonadota bacterium]|nr:DUF4886 domain-containing protein [Armatimonadota bacterium]